MRVCPDHKLLDIVASTRVVGEREDGLSRVTQSEELDLIGFDMECVEQKLVGSGGEHMV